MLGISYFRQQEVCFFPPLGKLMDKRGQLGLKQVVTEMDDKGGIAHEFFSQADCFRYATRPVLNTVGETDLKLVSAPEKPRKIAQIFFSRNDQDVGDTRLP